MRGLGLNQHIISLILLLLTLVSAKFFSGYFRGEEIFLITAFIALSLVHVNILNALIFLSYNTTDTPPKFALRLWNTQNYIFFFASVTFFAVCIGLVWNYLEELWKLEFDVNIPIPKIISLVILSIAYAFVMVWGVMNKAKDAYEAIEKINVRVSPRELISISSDEQASEWLVVYVYNNMNKILKDVNVKIDFPQDVEYYIRSIFSKKRGGTFEDNFSVEPGKFREIRILPVYVGDEKRTAGTIRVEVETPFGDYLFTITANLFK